MYYELMTTLYFKDKSGTSNIESYHWGIYNDKNQLEYQNKSI